MAGISTLKDGRRNVQWYQDGKQCRLSCGRSPMEVVEEIRLHVEELVIAKELTRPVQPKTRDWLATLDTKRHTKLAGYGLVEHRTAERCQWLSGFLDWVRRIKAAEVGNTSLEVYNKTIYNLQTFFGEVQMSSITRERVNEFREYLLTSANRRTGKGLAPATANKRLKTAREWFRAAAENGWIRDNPFAHLKGLENHAAGDESKKVYVSTEIIDKMIEHTPDVEWKLLISLWRYAGLRAVEPWFLKWDWIDWEANRMRVYAPKQRTAAKQWRVIPIWPEVEPHLRAQFDAAEPGEIYVIWRKRYKVDTGNRKDVHAAGSNAGSRFEKHLLKAVGIPPWPRLLQNLRTSGETDRNNDGRWSQYTIAKWWNHSLRTQEKHYLMVPDAEFEKVRPDESIPRVEPLGSNPKDGTLGYHPKG